MVLLTGYALHAGCEVLGRRSEQVDRIFCRKSKRDLSQHARALTFQIRMRGRAHELRGENR